MMKTPQIVSPEDAQRLRDASRLAPAEMLKRPFRISWWVYGGEPGPDYISETVAMAGFEDEVRALHLEAFFDRTIGPLPAKREVEKAVDEYLALNVLQCIFKSELLTTVFAEEADTSIAHGLKEVWQIEIDSIAVAKTFYEPFPASLSECRDAFRQVALALK